MKKAFIWLLVIVLIIVGSVWGTLAYLTDKETKTNTMTIGNVDIELLEYERTALESKNEDAAVQPFTQGTPLYPAVTEDDFDYSKYNAYVDWEQIGKSEYQSNIWDPADINNELDKMVFVKNTGDNSTYVRVFFAFEAGAYTNLDQFNEKVHLNLNTTDWTWKWEPNIAKIGKEKFFIATATYKYPLEAGDFTKISLSQISLDPTATNADVKAFNGEYNVPIFAQAIQTASFSDPVTALETGFGNDIPFEGITFDKGVTLKTAFTYFEGNTAGTNIYNNVENIIFGTKDAYPDVTSSHSGTLTSNDLGAPTHTYYVPSKTTEGNYDLYILADEGKIYTPKNSDSLFSGMTSLVTVNTSNLDVSKTTSMHGMFANCSSLNTIDTGSWDVGSVTNMRTMFSSCQSLETVDVSSWNVENVTFMNNMFQNCYKLNTLDVSDWDVSNVTKTASMFNSCYALQNIDVSDWTVSNVTDMSAMFQDCQTVTALDVSGWNTAGVNNISAMFSGCSNLASIDVSNWTVDNVTEMNSMFKYCPKLASPMNLSGWNVGKVTSMMLMFEGCTSLTELNVSGWNVSNATSLRAIFKNCNLLTELEVAGWSVSEKNTSLLDTFYGCSNLKQLDLSSWNVSGVTDMTRTFAACSSLSSLNVSTWDVGAVTTMAEMFNGCSSLASLNVSDWNVNKVTSMKSLFHNCSALTSLDVSGWSVVSVTAMNNMFLNCEKLTELDLSGWNTAKVEHARNMFRGCSELVTIYVGDGWEMSQIPEKNVGASSGEKSSALMFLECPKLVGEKGTTYKQNNVDKTYAIIDGGASNPGYLTYKAAEGTNP